LKRRLSYCDVWMLSISRGLYSIYFVSLAFPLNSPQPLPKLKHCTQFVTTSAIPLVSIPEGILQAKTRVITAASTADHRSPIQHYSFCFNCYITSNNPLTVDPRCLKLIEDSQSDPAPSRTTSMIRTTSGSRIIASDPFGPRNESKTPSPIDGPKPPLARRGSFVDRNDEGDGASFCSDAKRLVFDLNQVTDTEEDVVERNTMERNEGVTSTPLLEDRVQNYASVLASPRTSRTSTISILHSNQHHNSMSAAMINPSTSSRGSSPAAGSAMRPRCPFTCPRCPRTFKDQNKARYV
jgi:hypothetical protein